MRPECGPFVIQHNATLREMGLNGPQRATCVMSAPAAAEPRVLSRLGCAAGPRVRLFRPCHVQQLSGARSCRFGCSVHLQHRSRRHPRRLQCSFCGGVIVSQPGCKRLSARRPPLQRLMPARRRLAAAARATQRPRVTRSRLASHRSPPRSVWSCKGKPGQAVVPQSAVPSLADSLPPAPADPRRGPPCRRGSWRPHHGLPETDLVESGMTGSWRW